MYSNSTTKDQNLLCFLLLIKIILFVCLYRTFMLQIVFIKRWWFQSYHYTYHDYSPSHPFSFHMESQNHHMNNCLVQHLLSSLDICNKWRHSDLIMIFFLFRHWNTCTRMNMWRVPLILSYKWCFCCLDLDCWETSCKCLSSIHSKDE